MPSLRGCLSIALLLGLLLPAENTQATTPQLAAGYYHNAALKSDGTVWAWGWNGFGQIGNGTLLESSTPVQVKNLAGVTAIAAGFFHTVALKNDGSVWTWGDNGYRQLGIGENADAFSTLPVKVAGLDKVTAIAAGGGHTLALKDDGSVWAWGWNEFGQLGIQSAIDSGVPLQVKDLREIRHIAVGFFHSLAVNQGGEVWSWGYNGHGQLGNGSTIESHAPERLVHLHDVTQLAAGGGHTLALTNAGNVLAWGWNGFGQLGDGSVKNASVPQPVPGLSGVKALTAGFFHSLALGDDNQMLAWGYNGYGQLGNSEMSDAHRPAAVQDLHNIAAILANNHHSMALKNDGSIWSWGWNEEGQLGNGSYLSSSDPTQIKGKDVASMFNLGTSNYQDLWSDPDDPGWGIGITQHGDKIFASWYTYDGRSNPTWLTIGNGNWDSATSYSGMLYGVPDQDAGERASQAAWKQVQVGAASLDFSDADHATLRYSSNGASGARVLRRHVFDASGRSPQLNYSDTWAIPSEPGSGLYINQQFQTIFATWHTRDASGRPVWLVLPGGKWLNPTTYAGTLYRTASSATGIPFAKGVVTTSVAGSITLSFGDASNGTANTVVDGQAESRKIFRMQF